MDRRQLGEMSRRRGELVVLVAVLALTAGVPVALYATYLYAETIHWAALFVICALLFSSMIGFAIVRYRERIFWSLFKTSVSSLDELTSNLRSSIWLLLDKQPNEAGEEIELLLRKALSQYVWIQTRKWMVVTSTGLFIAFSALAGSALLKQQNDLIFEQNQYFQEQIKLQQEAVNQVTRSEAISIIYGTDSVASPRIKAEAVRSFVIVERIRISRGENTLPTEYINLHDADLSEAWLDSADLRQVSFRGSTLRKTNFNSTQLSGAVFRFADVSGAYFMNTQADQVQFMFSDLTGAIFSQAVLTEANFNQTILKGATISGDVRGASFYKANMENASLNLENWQQINTIDGTNIFGVRDAPDGFVEWALANGAIEVQGGLSDLSERAKEMRAVEERAWNSQG